MNQVQSTQQQMSHAASLIQQSSSETRQCPCRGDSLESASSDTDRVELSDEARAYGPSPEDVELDPHVQEVRSAIADGTYLTPEKLDVVVDRLFEELYGAGG